MGSIIRDTSTLGIGFSNRNTWKVLLGGAPSQADLRPEAEGLGLASCCPGFVPPAGGQAQTGQEEARQDTEHQRDLVTGRPGAGKALLRVADVFKGPIDETWRSFLCSPKEDSLLLSPPSWTLSPCSEGPQQWGHAQGSAIWPEASRKARDE